jgi:hypothetical protein
MELEGPNSFCLSESPESPPYPVDISGIRSGAGNKAPMVVSEDGFVQFG